MSAPPASSARPRVQRIVIVVAGLLAAATITVGLTIHARTGELGTASPPFVLGWAPAVDLLWLVGAVAVAGAVLLLAPRWLDAAQSPLKVAASLLVVSLAVGLSVNAARAGTHAWIEPFDLQGGLARGNAINEYLPGLPTLDDGVRNYLDRFAEVVPSQSVNIAGHPPGPLLLASLVGATTPAGLAALVILLGACCAPLTHRLARAFDASERDARLAGLLCACAPGLVLVGVTSFDFAYAAFGVAAALGLVARDWRWRIVGAAIFAVGSLMSWALLGVGAWAAVAVWRRDGLRAAVGIAVLAGLATVLLQGALALAAGYDPIGTLRATEQVYRDSLARVRPYWFWVLGSPTAWGVMLSPLIVGAWLAGAVRGSAPAIALAVILLVAALGGFTKAETERIWLFMGPLACVAAAPVLARWRTRPVLAALLAQALAVSVLANTVW